MDEHVFIGRDEQGTRRRSGVPIARRTSLHERQAAMSGILAVTCVGLFLATAPMLLILRLVRPARMPWWLIVILAAVLGWVWANLSVVFYYEHLDALIAQYGHGQAPQELMDEWQNDGAKRVFALLFGWLYGLIYLAPWLVAYGVLQGVRKVASSRRRAAA